MHNKDASLEKEIVKHHYSEQKYNLYKNRVIAYCVFLLCSLSLCLYLGFNIVKKEEIKPVNYSDTGVVDYRVYLKENEFYTENFLPKGKSYITSLIDYVEVNYNYVFSISEITDMSFDYKILADLIIENSANDKELYRNQYTILDTKNKNLRGSNELVINEKFQLDYGYYNQLANKFRSSYGIDTNSYLKVYLNVDKKTSDTVKYKISENSNITEITLPLSEKAIEINIDSNSNNSNNQVTTDDKYHINFINIILFIIFLLLSLLFIKIIIKSAIKMSSKRSTYDKYIKKILKEYDRLVVETRNVINLKEYNIINVSKFSELLDVRDNLKIPIIYYCYLEHIKGMFYVKNDNDVYLLPVSVDNIEND